MLLKHPRLCIAAAAVVVFAATFAAPRLHRPVQHEAARVVAAPARLEALSKTKARATGRLDVTLTLQEAIAYHAIQAVLAGNGRDILTVRVTNPGKRPVRIEVPAGLVLQSGQDRVVIMRHQLVEVGPCQTRSEEIRTAAMSAANATADALYQPAADSDRRIQPILTHAARHPEVTDDAIQTAILAITDNLPVRAFAKFEMIGSDVPSRLDTRAFRVDTVEIVNALALLRDIGLRDDRIALTIDPQLKVEAMIDPLAHAAAMNYYGIPFEKEWAYWKTQLLDGDPATRHYALFGIARFYPDIAVQMMPNWAREAKLEPVFRASAIQALAETRRPQALSVLQQLTFDLGDQMTDLGRTAHLATQYLEQHLQPSAQPRIRLRGADIQLRPDAEPPRRSIAALGVI